MSAHAHPEGPGRRGAQRQALIIALVANAGYPVVEVVGGVAFHSLALMADGAHMASDVVALVVALVALSLMDRPATDRHSFGLRGPRCSAPSSTAWCSSACRC